MRTSLVSGLCLLAGLLGGTGCGGKSAAGADTDAAETSSDTDGMDINDEAGVSGHCVPKTWDNEESGCAPDLICLGEEGCYPRAGLPDGSCVQPSTVNVRISLRGAEVPYGGFVEREWNGVVAAVSSETLELDADDITEAIVIDYDIGSYRLPVIVGDRIRLRWRITQPFGSAQGFAIWSSTGELLTVIDDGVFGSAWVQIPGGFAVRTEVAGCPVDSNEYSAIMRMAIRFMHEGADDIVVPPGESAIMTIDTGERFVVVNAHAERFIYMLVTDAVPKVSWIILRTP